MFKINNNYYICVMEFKTLKERYTEMMANKISVSIDDLSDNEISIIEGGYALFTEKMEEIKKKS